MQPKRLPVLETPKRAPVPIPDWLAAATEARRQRDDMVKAELRERHRQRRKGREAWSPAHEISQHR
jgi:hypothetical protein